MKRTHYVLQKKTSAQNICFDSKNTLRMTSKNNKPVDHGNKDVTEVFAERKMMSFATSDLDSSRS